MHKTNMPASAFGQKNSIESPTQVMFMHFSLAALYIDGKFIV